MRAMSIYGAISMPYAMFRGLVDGVQSPPQSDRFAPQQWSKLAAQLDSEAGRSLLSMIPSIGYPASELNRGDDLDRVSSTLLRSL